MHNKVRFILAGQVEELRHCEPTRTVLEYLREDKGLTGTKEGCAEGDCGACTVVIGELHEDAIRYRAVNSCIQFLPSLDGKQLITVEDLAAVDNSLHAVQQAMVDEHGSQCGFCTPGFVMSLFAMFHNRVDHDVERAEIDLGLAGNLCRCTGYAPIVRAAEQALTANRNDHFTADETSRIEQLQSIQPEGSLVLSNDEQLFYTPQSVDELCDLLHKHPQATMVAGATDVGLWVTKHMRKLDTVIYLGGVAELKQIDTDGDDLLIGAAVTYTDAAPAITQRYPGFLSLIERLGATQVRNAGTVGGNIANGSPIGDMPPGLIVLGARLVLRSTQGQRSIDLENYFISYGKQDLRSGECVEQIILPAPADDLIFSTYNISKRFEQDISAVCAAFALQIKDGLIVGARVCFGGMAEIPKRATCCEHALNGKNCNQGTISNAMQALLNDFAPLTDMRASDRYRMRVAQNLLQRFYLEHSDKPYPVRLGLRYANAHQNPDIADV